MKCDELNHYASIYYDSTSMKFTDSLKSGGIYCPGRADCNKLNDGTSKIVCQQCPNGRYADVPGQTSCKDCPPGKFLNYNEAGVNSCQPCQNGTISGAAASECEPCIPGEYHDTSGNTCKKCPGGRFQNAKGTSHTPGSIIDRHKIFNPKMRRLSDPKPAML